MSSAFAYPLRLPGWKLAVHLGLSIKTEVLVVFDKETQHFEARCYDFDRKHPTASTRFRSVVLTYCPCKRRWMQNFMRRSKRPFPKNL